MGMSMRMRMRMSTSMSTSMTMSMRMRMRMSMNEHEHEVVTTVLPSRTMAPCECSRWVCGTVRSLLKRVAKLEDELRSGSIPLTMSRLLPAMMLPSPRFCPQTSSTMRLLPTMIQPGCMIVSAVVFDHVDVQSPDIFSQHIPAQDDGKQYEYVANNDAAMSDMLSAGPRR